MCLDCNETCDICNGSFEKFPEQARILTSCEHQFHSDCLGRWMKGFCFGTPCPKCRKYLSNCEAHKLRQYIQDVNGHESLYVAWDRETVDHLWYEYLEACQPKHHFPLRRTRQRKIKKSKRSKRHY